MKKNIKKYLVSNFVKEYKRVPSESELLALFRNLEKEYPEIENIGLSSSNIKEREEKLFFNAGSESKSSTVEKSVGEVILDLKQLDEEYSTLIEKQESESIDQARIFKNLNEKINHLIKKINLEILLKGRQDIFSYGIIEDFSTRDKVRNELSTVRILDNNKVTLSYLQSKEEKIDISEVGYEINHRRSNQLSFNVFGELKDLLEEDEKFFKIETSSEIEDDVVDFIFNIDFRIPKNIEQIKYKLQALQTNGKMQEEVFYSTNGVDFNQMDIGVNVNEEINYIDLNNEEIKYKKIIIKFRKTGFDYKKNNKFFYVFSFDYLGFIENLYKPNTQGTLFLGPYEILDEDNLPVEYSLATIKAGTCCEIPNTTSINFYLSKNGIDYYKCGYSNESSNIVSFEDNTNFNILNDFEVIDYESSYEFLVENVETLIEEYTLGECEEFLNVVLLEESVSKVNLNTLLIKRNIFNNKDKNTDSFFSGWKKKADSYECNIEINNGKGVTIDFGFEDAIHINGISKSGKVFIPEGKHRVEVNVKYFQQMLAGSEKLIPSERNLSKKDRFYPYNHKLLIEGFDYKKGFKGNKRYKKLGYMYASELKKQSNTFFNESGSYDDYTILDISGNKYILIKDLDSNGKLESYNITYKNRSLNAEDTASNLLYIKAVLETESIKISPKIDQIQVRVI